MLAPPYPKHRAVSTVSLRVAAAASLVLAALSLLVAERGIAVVAYDPTVWLIWGREIPHLELSTIGGPTWKPLPVLFTTPFSLLGDGAAPSLWLVVARAGGIFGLFMAYRVAARAAGPVAGALALLFLAVERDYLTNAVRGESEAMMVALALLAVDRHLAGRRGQAFAAAVGVALLRPESWALVGLYALLLLHHARGTPAFRRTAVMVFGTGVVVAVLWFVPEKLASGAFLRGAQRARDPVAGSPAQADFPFLAVFANSAKALIWPIYVGALAGAVAGVSAWARRRAVTAELVLAVAASIHMVIVALLAQGGFTGNVRYVIPPAGFVAVLAGIGFVRAAQWAAARWSPRVATVGAVAVALVAAPWVVRGVDQLVDRGRKVREVGRLYRGLDDAIAKAGGPAALRDCGAVTTGPYQTPALAWALDVPQHRIQLRPERPGSIVAPYYVALTRDQAYPLVTADARWVVRSTCALGG